MNVSEGLGRVSGCGERMFSKDFPHVKEHG